MDERGASSSNVKRILVLARDGVLDYMLFRQLQIYALLQSAVAVGEEKRIMIEYPKIVED